MVGRLAEMSLFLKNCGEERKTSKPASVTVSVTCEREAPTSSRLVTLPLLAARDIFARSSTLAVTLARLLVLRSSARIFEEKR